MSVEVHVISACRILNVNERALQRSFAVAALALALKGWSATTRADWQRCSQIEGGEKRVVVRRHRPRTNKSPKVNVDLTDYFKKAHGRFVDFLDKAKSQSAIHVVSTENDRNKRHKPPLIRVDGLVDAFKLVAWQMQMLGCFRFLQWCR